MNEAQAPNFEHKVRRKCRLNAFHSILFNNIRRWKLFGPILHLYDFFRFQVALKYVGGTLRLRDKIAQSILGAEETVKVIFIGLTKKSKFVFNFLNTPIEVPKRQVS